MFTHLKRASQRTRIRLVTKLDLCLTHQTIPVWKIDNRKETREEKRRSRKRRQKRRSEEEEEKGQNFPFN